MATPPMNPEEAKKLKDAAAALLIKKKGQRQPGEEDDDGGSLTIKQGNSGLKSGFSNILKMFMKLLPKQFSNNDLKATMGQNGTGPNAGTTMTLSGPGKYKALQTVLTSLVKKGFKDANFSADYPNDQNAKKGMQQISDRKLASQLSEVYSGPPGHKVVMKSAEAILKFLGKALLGGKNQGGASLANPQSQNTPSPRRETDKNPFKINFGIGRPKPKKPGEV